jgi:hypothetical protein
MPVLQHLIDDFSDHAGVCRALKITVDVPDIAATLNLGDNVEIGAFRKHHPGAPEQVEAATDAPLAFPGALGDYSKLPVLPGQQGQNPVRFAVIEPSKDDRISLVCRHRRNFTVGGSSW